MNQPPDVRKEPHCPVAILLSRLQPCFHFLSVQKRSRLQQRPAVFLVFVLPPQFFRADLKIERFAPPLQPYCAESHPDHPNYDFGAALPQKPDCLFSNIRDTPRRALPKPRLEETRCPPSFLQWPPCTSG